jgi:hypothetical protein
MTKLATRTAILIFLCFTIASTIFVHAETPVVGVSQGDVFEYDMVSHWNSLLTDQIPPSLVELNQTEWVKVTITEVSGTLIQSQVKTHYRNGTETTEDGACDIDTGDLAIAPPIIGANLGRNDLVNPSASEPWYINETVTRNYKGGPRETNHLRLESVGTSETVGEFTNIYDYYFDKSTGVLVEYTTEFSYSGLESITQSKLISSNVWVVEGTDGNQPTDSPTNPPDSPTTGYIVAAAAAIIIVVIVVVIILKKRKNK